MTVQPTHNLSLADLDRQSFLHPSKQAFDPKHKVAARVVQSCLCEGLITRNLPSGDVVAFSPPLTITADDAELIASRFAQGLDKAVASLRTEGIWRG